MTNVKDLLSLDLNSLRLRHFETACMADLSTLLPKEKEHIMILIQKWCRIELAERNSISVKNRIRNANFQRIQTIDMFNFDRNVYTKRIRSNYMTLYDVIEPDELPSAVFIGLAGLGKTHLARALGYRSCQLNLSVIFITTASMINALEQAKKAACLDSELQKYRRPLVLILDEFGYVSFDAQASNLLFQVISARHDQGLGTIVTSNIAFSGWNQFLANDAITHAIVDRLTAEAEVFHMEGPTYRPLELEIRKSRRQEKAKAKRNA